MVATFPSSLKTNFSSQKLNLGAIAARKIAQPEPENVQAEVDTWDTYCRTLRRATVDAIAARRTAQRDYKKIQAEAERWEKRLQLALEDDREDLVCEALLHRNACRDRVRQLKALVERHSIQVSILKSQMADWENQI